MPKIFLIYGPSGVGQDSVIEGLAKKIKFTRPITTTSRPKRHSEKQGRPYYFVSKNQFEKMIKEKKFFEWARVYGDYKGCTKKEIKRILKQNRPTVWKIDWQGANTIKKLIPKSVVILIAPSSYKILQKRLLARGTDSLKTIKARQKLNQDWNKNKHVYDYKVINYEGRLKETIKKMVQIIREELKK